LRGDGAAKPIPAGDEEKMLTGLAVANKQKGDARTIEEVTLALERGGKTRAVA
jgi:hypothetical protein